jgi:hypothetical protein
VSHTRLPHVQPNFPVSTHARVSLLCRALRVQGCLAALGLGAAGTAAAASPKGEARLLWSLSAALLAALAPYTLLVMIPAHDRVMQEVRGATCRSSCSPCCCCPC